ncbi:hypothetical protein I4U23_000786 [Adineta vaga]|nr:hypothetical protein I4U23_000786 [Adineta vaga]
MALPSKLHLIYYIAIALTGLIGNTTTIFVFSQRRLRSLRSSFFLTCLAITDLLFILILVIVFLDELNVPIMTAPVCMLTIYLSHIASFLSSNFTLAYTSHRLIAVFFPMKSTAFLKQRTNRILALTLLLFASIFYSLSFPVTTTKLRSNTTNVVHCEEDRQKKLLFPFLVFDTLFTFIIPFTMITCMNLAIVCKLKGKLAYMQKLPIHSSSTNSSRQSASDSVHSSQLANENNNNNEAKCLLHRQNRSLLCVRPIHRYKDVSNRFIPLLTAQKHSPLYHTNASFPASTVFLVFNLPYHFLLFCFLLNQQQPTWMLDAVNIARLWFFASFCVNFFVYAICGQRFRNEVVRLFSCSVFRRYFDKRNQKQSKSRQNSIYFNHRLTPITSTRLSQSN